MKKTKEKGITLVALVITIIILLILAGITIGTLGGENGLIAKVNQAKKAQIKAEMKETLILAINELQLEKEGKATLENITKEWADKTLEDYKAQITSDASISGKKITMQKSGVTGKYIIDENLNITEIENDSSIEFSYEVFERKENMVSIRICVQDKENGLSKIELPGEDTMIVEGDKKREIGKDYEVELGVEYKIKITSENGQTKEETILITDYWYKITKDLGEGIEIDNPVREAAYNNPYQATITAENEDSLDTICVKMGGQEVTTDGSNIVDKTTGKIYIEKVIGDIEITAKNKLYLIKNGVTNEKLTGGWEVVPHAGRNTNTLVPEDGRLNFGALENGVIYRVATKNVINYNGYKKLVLDAEIYETLTSWEAYGHISIGVTSDKSKYSESDLIVRSTEVHSGQLEKEVKITHEITEGSDKFFFPYIQQHRCKMYIYNLYFL